MLYVMYVLMYVSVHVLLLCPVDLLFQLSLYTFW